MTPLASRTGLVARITGCRLDSRTVVLGVTGAVAGGLCGLLGVAGGVVIVPVLTSRRIGMARATASGTTIAAVLPISVVAALTYAGLHDVDESAAYAIVPGAAAGVIIGSLLATRVRASVLRRLFHLVLLATAVRLLVVLPSGSIHQIAVEVPAAVTLCALGTVAGLASGMLGSGGGTFLVPALVVGFGLVQQVAQGTALLALIPIWIIGALTHHKTHTLGLPEAVALGSCGALTVPLGAEIASHVGALPMRVIFAAFLIATVSRGLVHTRNRGNQPPQQAAAQPRGGCPEPGTHLQAVLHRLAHPQLGTARADPGPGRIAAYPPGLIPGPRSRSLRERQLLCQCRGRGGPRERIGQVSAPSDGADPGQQKPSPDVSATSMCRCPPAATLAAWPAPADTRAQ